MNVGPQVYYPLVNHMWKIQYYTVEGRTHLEFVIWNTWMVTFKWNSILVSVLRQIGYHRYIDVGDTVMLVNTVYEHSLCWWQVSDVVDRCLAKSPTSRSPSNRKRKRLTQQSAIRCGRCFIWTRAPTIKCLVEKIRSHARPKSYPVSRIRYNQSILLLFLQVNDMFARYVTLKPGCNSIILELGVEVQPLHARSPSFKIQ